MEQKMRFRHNVMQVNSLSAFEGIKGRVNQNCKDVYFVRLVGINDTLISDLEKMDYNMTKRMQNGQVFYQRVINLPALSSPQEAAEYENFYQAWIAQGKKRAAVRVLKENEEYGSLLGNGICKVVDLYSANKTVSSSMEKNFVIKLLFWHDFLLKDVLVQWNSNLSVKLVLANIVKQQEYLFTYLLTLLGYDVLLVQSEQDIAEREENLGLSQRIQIGGFGKEDLPVFHKDKVIAEINEKVSSGQGSAATSRPVSIVHPDRKARAASGTALKSNSAQSAVLSRRPVLSGQSEQGTSPSPHPVSIAHPTRRPSAPHILSETASAEKSFEQLALLASSVVMIAIHDKKGNIIGTGSGIMIGTAGYILTNNHVASGGRFYSVRIEDDETVYSTDEVIKYHSVLDLAILRIDRSLTPLSIYKGGKPLVRGQKVVAIGSPLGLFNSVSDGIISGFRKIDGVDMIQFTAPTSHGSSGGAVLNMYGEVIGISTAGFNAGQNINLAMGYECINQFIAGFV